MTKDTRKTRVLFVPNEDGFGPSALGFYVVKALLETKPDWQVVVWNKTRFSYNQTLYSKQISLGNVVLDPVWNIIQLQKQNEIVSIPGTLDIIGDYRSSSDDYPNRSSAFNYDLVVDIGVPAAARWAKKNKLKSLSIFDHCWSKTLSMILTNTPSTGEGVVSADKKDRWERFVRQIRDDEAATQSVFLFPNFITPEVYYTYWRDEIGTRIEKIPGVLSGRSGRSPRIQSALGLNKSGKTILVQGGDTPAWDRLLKALVPALIKEDQEALKKEDLNILIYIPERLNDVPNIKDAHRHQLERVQLFNVLPGGTLQTVLPFVDLIVTRAGGGTVNDAVAHRTPFVSVREPGQMQVEAILDSCLDRGLTRPIDPREIERDPLDIILREYGMKDENKRVEREMSRIPSGAEEKIVREIVRICQR